MQESRVILFAGRVQGVGFRMTTVQLARGLELSGTVRNLADGRVELVVQGPAAEIETLVGRLREHFGELIRRVEQAPHAASGQANDGIQIVH
ncbi:MAG TPA: acylphosphatase [Phycisphaerae bacterium]|nr:acylphosphatase [Phycisphaerae bacterium]